MIYLYYNYTTLYHVSLYLFSLIFLRVVMLWTRYASRLVAYILLRRRPSACLRVALRWQLEGPRPE